MCDFAFKCADERILTFPYDKIIGRFGRHIEIEFGKMMTDGRLTYKADEKGVYTYTIKVDYESYLFETVLAILLEDTTEEEMYTALFPFQTEPHAIYAIVDLLKPDFVIPESVGSLFAY